MVASTVRAKKSCPVAGCPNVQPCAVHPQKAWAGGSPRRARRQREGLSGWQEQKIHRAVLARSRVCWLCGKDGATQVDHVDRTKGTSIENLRPVHSDCHRKKTQAEAQQARRAQLER